jgi:hypothetical protein
MGELMLDLLGLVGVMILAMLAFWGCMTLLARLLWRSRRTKITACATRIAETLGLSTIPSPDARMSLWHGPVPGGELWLATGANHRGPTDLPFDPAGPGFDHVMPPISFQHLGNLLLVARLARPLPVTFTASSAYGVFAGFKTGDNGFDQRYKLNGTDVAAVQQLFANTPLCDDLLGIFGPDCRSPPFLPRFGEKRKREATGVVISMNAQGMVVYWGSPREEFAAEFGFAVVKAVGALATVPDS